MLHQYSATPRTSPSTGVLSGLKKSLALLIVSGSLLPISGYAANLLHVDANGNFADNNGAKVTLRGFNLSQWHKKPPFRPNQDPALFPTLTSMGVNVVRLQFNWEAYEPAPNVYDQSYLNYYISVVDRAAAEKIHVVIDIHQDMLSRWSIQGCGEGFPKWVAEKVGSDISTPDNGLKCNLWAIRASIQQNKLHKIFNNLYDSSEVQAQYMTMLQNIAQRVKDNPYVVGYDVLNEPWGDDAKLVKFWQKATDNIRKIHPDAIIFVEHKMLQGDGSAITIPNPKIPNLAFAPHYYDFAASFLQLPSITDYTPIGANRRQIAKNWGAANFIGEFGATPSWFALGFLDTIYADMDKFGDSGTMWAYTPEWDPIKKDGFNMEDLSPIDNTGKYRNNYRDRPYIQRTAGTQSSLKVSYSATLFNKIGVGVAWDNALNMGSTRIFVPNSFLLPENTKISTTGGVSCAWSTMQLLDCQSKTAGIKTVSLSKRF